MKLSPQLVRALAPLFMAGIPLLLFFVPNWSQVSRSTGWQDTLATIQYYAAAYEATGSAPGALNLPEGIGFPTPLFRQPLLFPILGLAASKIGAMASVTLFIFLMLVLAYVGIRAALRSLKIHRADGPWAAVLCWMGLAALLYYDTLFSRIAAYILFLTGICYLWLFIREPTDASHKAAAAVSWLCFSLTLGIYPEHAVSFAIIFAVIFFVFLWFSFARHQALMGTIGILFGVCVTAAPWTYTITHFGVWGSLTSARGSRMEDLDRFQIKEGFSAEPHPEWEGLPPVKAEFSSAHPNQIPPLKISVEQPSLIRTNIVAFPWNRIRVGKHLLEPGNAIVIKGRLAFAVPSGSHSLEYVFAPSPEWKLVKQLSLAAFMTGLFMLWFLSVRAALAKAH